MTVQRRYFRYDVSLAMHLEPVDRFGKHLGAERRQLVTTDEEGQLTHLNYQIEQALEKIFGINSNALYVFYVLNHRLNFMWWLLDLLVESEDPSLATDFKFRCKEDAKFSVPKSRTESVIAPLIIAFYEVIDSYISELLSVVDNSLEGKIFIYSTPEDTQFDDTQFVKNLDELANEGVLPAKITRLLIDKLNLQLTVFFRLKEAFQKLSQPQEWPQVSINLSAGGFSFFSKEHYALFSQWDIFMQIAQEVMICRGKVTSVTASGHSDLPFRIGIEFDLLTGEQQHKITLFEQRTELHDAMQHIDLN